MWKFNVKSLPLAPMGVNILYVICILWSRIRVHSCSWGKQKGKWNSRWSLEKRSDRRVLDQLTSISPVKQYSFRQPHRSPLVCPYKYLLIEFPSSPFCRCPFTGWRNPLACHLISSRTVFSFFTPVERDWCVGHAWNLKNFIRWRDICRVNEMKLISSHCLFLSLCGHC